MTQRANTKPAVAPEPVDQDALSLKALAKAILAREFRPRVASVRRLAEAVLEDSKKPKKKKKKASSSSKPSNKQGGKQSGKGSGKKRKLAKIPGQKKDRKKGK